MGKPNCPLQVPQKCPLQVPQFIELPSSCCCGQVKLGTASRFFCVLRLIVSIFMVSTTLEDFVRFDFERKFEHTFVSPEMAEFHELDEKEVEELEAHMHRNFIIAYFSLTTAVMVFGTIELIMCSLHIHGARKKLPNFIRPYVIWTGMLMTFLSIILLLFITLLISKPHIVGLILVVITGGFLSICATDFIYGLAYMKQMRALVGLDHVRLNEI